eukprot:740991_1
MSMSFPPNPKTSAIVGAVSVATVSFLASLVIVLMIVLKKKGERLSTPYRRIIFGISVSDMIQSFALLSGPFLIPSWTENSFGLGNNVTCAMDGFFLSIGSTAVPLETALLSFYYLCKLKFRLTNETFAWRFEFICHAFIVLFVLIKASVSVGIGIIGVNPINSFCFYIYQPNGCQFVPEVVGECEPRRKIYSDIFYAMQLCFEPMIFLVLALVFTGMLYCHAISLNRVISNEILDSKHRVSTHISRRKDTDSIHEESTHISCRKDTDSIHEESMDVRASEHVGSASEERVQCVVDEETLTRLPHPQPGKLYSFAKKMRDNEVKSRIGQQSISLNESVAGNDVLAQPKESKEESQLASQNRVRHLSNLYTAETKAQAACYLGVFLITYLPLTLGYILNNCIGMSFPIVVKLFTFVYPLGGFFNMLVYTRPHVASLRRNHQGRISRIHALFLVLRAGGEVPTGLMSPPGSTSNDGHVVPQYQAEKSLLETDAPFGLEVKKKILVLNSLDSVDGLSQSMEEEDRYVYNPRGKFYRAEVGILGEESQINGISYEGSSEIEGQSTTSSTRSIWAASFKRVREYNP